MARFNGQHVESNTKVGQLAAGLGWRVVIACKSPILNLVHQNSPDEGEEDSCIVILEIAHHGAARYSYAKCRITKE